MLHDEDDPLSGSFFNVPRINTNATTTSASLFDSSHTNRSPLTTSFYTSSPQYEEDPWGSFGASSRFESMTSSPPTLQGHTSFATSATVPPENRTTDRNTITITNVLYGIRLPEIYETMYYQIQRYGRIPLPSLHRMLESSGVTAMDIERIMRIAVPNMTSDIGKTEFNVILALVACAQNRIEITLNSLYRNRHALPEPTFNINSQPSTASIDQHSNPTSPVTQQTSKSDPLSSNALLNGQDHDDHLSSSSSLPKRDPKMKGYPGMNSPRMSPTRHMATQHNGIVEYKHQQRPSTGEVPTKTLDTQSWFQKVEEIKITIAPEREGFIFKHVNYIVESQKRSSIVLRRFSDFWWLMEALARRYPFRTLPHLPPKKVGGRDSAFLEKRRKGLSRYINAVIRHPTLRNDDVVIKFLTEPSELAAWRKQHPPSIEEEFRRNQHNMEEIRSMIPETLEEQLRKARQRVDIGIEHYVNLCFIMERMIRRMHGQATDFVRYSITLNSLAETEHRYHSDCEQCQQVIQGYENVAKHMHRESTILENQVSSAADGVLENLKRFRDLLVSFRELEERRDKLGGSQIESLKKRIANNRTKINQHKGVPGLEAEVAKLEELLRNDQVELYDQENRQLYIQFCMWCELIYMHKQQAFVSSLYRNYVQEMTQYSKKRADNWKELEGLVFQMPVEPPLFN
ncbi:hypothetical protein BDA99DRAFT_501024 [Phascolomyces articulosus]|uniref:Sorting nexin MVP1 n=1 Tax=Phascolomyces articulosus TaxID=60185 RepID=A0AAD5KII0_9FUNG|nr:hypothetical protein BDA99DRAFT_501024 [Phascolomyces articulosus]